MKFNKLISLFAAVSTLAVSMVIPSVASAEITPITLKITSAPATDVTLEGYDVYKVKYSLSGLTEVHNINSTKTDASKKRYVYDVGRGFMNFNVVFDEVTSTNVHNNSFVASDDWDTYGWDTTSNNLKVVQSYFGNTGFSKTSEIPLSSTLEKDALAGTASVSSGLYYYTTSKGDSFNSSGDLDILETYWYIKSGESFTIAYSKVQTTVDFGASDTDHVVYYGIPHNNNEGTIKFEINGEEMETPKLTLGTAKTEYTVTFMNGETQVRTGKVEEGTAITAPTDPAKTGYTFVGWYTGENGAGTKFTTGTTATADVTYYAYFTEDAPVVQTPSAEATQKYSSNAGYIWNVLVKNLGDKSVGYKFTSGEDKLEGTFNLQELSGNFNFDVILNTTKADVTLDVSVK